MTTWTKELPKESGFYWTRSMFLDGEMEVVEFDAKEGTVTGCGNEIGLGEWWGSEIEGEWWPVRLLPPHGLHETITETGDKALAKWKASDQTPHDIRIYAASIPRVEVKIDPNQPNA